MTDIKQGMVLAGVGLSFRRRDYINRGVVQELAHTIVREVQPRYGYCAGIFGWDGAWGAALIEAKVPYCMVLPYRKVGINWFHGCRDELHTYISKAEDVVYISDRYREDVYVDRDKYLVSHVEGLVLLNRPLITRNRVATLAKELGIPLLDLWHQYNHALLNDQEDNV